MERIQNIRRPLPETKTNGKDNVFGIKGAAASLSKHNFDSAEIQQLSFIFNLSKRGRAKKHHSLSTNIEVVASQQMDCCDGATLCEQHKIINIQRTISRVRIHRKFIYFLSLSISPTSSPFKMGHHHHLWRWPTCCSFPSRSVLLPISAPRPSSLRQPQPPLPPSDSPRNPAPTLQRIVCGSDRWPPPNRPTPRRRRRSTP